MKLRTRTDPGSHRNLLPSFLGTDPWSLLPVVVEVFKGPGISRLVRPLKLTVPGWSLVLLTWPKSSIDHWRLWSERMVGQSLVRPGISEWEILVINLLLAGPASAVGWKSKILICTGSLNPSIKQQATSCDILSRVNLLLDSSVKHQATSCDNVDRW